jgi:hypothetical protein
LLPTPVAHDTASTAENFMRKKNRYGTNRKMVTSLNVMMTGCLLPTPTTGYSTSEPEDWMERKKVANRGHASTVTNLLVLAKSLPGCQTVPSTTTVPPLDGIPPS